MNHLDWRQRQGKIVRKKNREHRFKVRLPLSATAAAAAAKDSTTEILSSVNVKQKSLRTVVLLFKETFFLESLETRIVAIIYLFHFPFQKS